MSPKLLYTLAKVAMSKEGQSLLRRAGTQLSDSDKIDLTDEINKGESKGYSTSPVDKTLREIIVGDPKNLGIRAGISAGENLTGALANISENNANRLAAALLARNRVQTPEQEALYGISTTDKVNQAVAENMIRKGNNAKTIWNSIGQFIGDVGSTYKQRDDLARSMEAAQMTDLPGTFYNYANGVQSRANKATKNRR